MDKPIFAYELKKDTIYEFHWSRSTQIFILRAGEKCHYFKHSDTYLFESREGIVPYYDRKTVEAFPEFFEPTDLPGYYVVSEGYEGYPIGNCPKCQTDSWVDFYDGDEKIGYRCTGCNYVKLEMEV